MWVTEKLTSRVIRSYLFHDGAIEDCVADEIIMRNDILKDMNIDYAAKIYNNIMNRQREYRQIVSLTTAPAA